MLLSDPTTTSHDASGPHEPTELKPVRVADVLRRLQALTLVERGTSIGLEVDESLHIAADEPLLLAALDDILRLTLSSEVGDARVVVRCRAEEPGVVIEVDGELADDHTDSALSPARLVIEGMGGVLSNEHDPEEGRILALHFPLMSAKRASTAPAGRSASGLLPAINEPPPRKTGDGSF
jgi:hypothetical protein